VALVFAAGVAPADDELTGHWAFACQSSVRGCAPSDRGNRATVDEPGPGSERQDGPEAGEQTVDLFLRLGPAGIVTGTIGVDAGRSGGAPGNNPLRPVEISDGRLEGGRLTFSAWQFDRYSNRVRCEGTLRDDVLTLRLSRETDQGVETTEVEATRVTD